MLSMEENVLIQEMNDDDSEQFTKNEVKLLSIVDKLLREVYSKTLLIDKTPPAETTPIDQERPKEMPNKSNFISGIRPKPVDPFAEESHTGQRAYEKVTEKTSSIRSVEIPRLQAVFEVQNHISEALYNTGDIPISEYPKILKQQQIIDDGLKAAYEASLRLQVLIIEGMKGLPDRLFNGPKSSGERLDG